MSQIFEPFRCAGVITSETAPHVQTLGTASFVTCSVGKAFQVYDIERLRLKFVSPTVRKRIRCVAAHRQMTYVGSGKRVLVMYRAGTGGAGSREGDYSLRGHAGRVSHLLLFGASHLVSVDDRRQLLLWDLSRRASAMHEPLRLGDADDGAITCVLHPHTYVNKVLVADEGGRAQLWNFSTRRLLYEFPGWSSSVLCMQQAPALDVVAFGLADGRVVLHNIREDRTLMVLQEAGGGITGVAFSSLAPIMVCATDAGSFSVWDLTRRHLLHQQKRAHSAAISMCHFLPKEPVLVTSGGDNALRVWLFENGHKPRLLRERSGHSAPPSRLHFYGPEGQRLLSASADGSLREFSLIQDHRSVCFSAKKIKALKRFAAVQGSDVGSSSRSLTATVDLAGEPIREKEWDNLVTCHAGDKSAYTWRYTNKVLGKHALTADAPLRCCAVSPCGNFVLCGSASGALFRWNIQSGLARGSVLGAHEGPIQAVAVDALSSYALTIGVDGQLRKWSMQDLSLVQTHALAAPAHLMRFHREAGLLCLALDNFDLCVLDADTFRDVRLFHGHHDEITALTFSGDGRWVLSASADGSVRTWDIISSNLLDCFGVPTVVRAMDFSPRNDMLALSFRDRVGVYLWSNQMFYSDVFLKPVPAEVRVEELPGVRPAEEFFLASDYEAELRPQQEEEEELQPGTDVWAFLKEAAANDHALVRTSGLPTSRWMSFYNLEEIKKRNKPVEPPKAPERAPFFLPTVPGLELQFDKKRGREDDEEQQPQDEQQPLSVAEADRFTALVRQGEQGHQELFEALREMTASRVDLEIRLLETGEDLMHFVRFLRARLASLDSFELMQGFLHCFLKAHSEQLAGDEALKQQLRELAATHEEAWSRVSDSLNHVSSMVSFYAKLQSF